MALASPGEGPRIGVEGAARGIVGVGEAITTAGTEEEEEEERGEGEGTKGSGKENRGPISVASMQGVEDSSWRAGGDWTTAEYDGIEMRQEGRTVEMSDTTALTIQWTSSIVYLLNGRVYPDCLAVAPSPPRVGSGGKSEPEGGAAGAEAAAEAVVAVVAVGTGTGTAAAAEGRGAGGTGRTEEGGGAMEREGCSTERCCGGVM
jgi:hypothetical protein